MVLVLSDERGHEVDHPEKTSVEKEVDPQVSFGSASGVPGFEQGSGGQEKDVEDDLGGVGGSESLTLLNGGGFEVLIPHLHFEILSVFSLDPDLGF